MTITLDRPAAQTAPDSRPRVALYARISLDRTEQAAGVANQLAEMEEFAKKNRWRIIPTEPDNSISAFSGKHRPGYQQVLSLAKAREIDIVLCVRADRLWREEVDRAEGAKVLRLNGVQVWQVHGGLVDLATANGRLANKISGATSEWESDVKSERVMATSKQRASDGLDNAGLGYGWQRQAKHRWVEHPDHGPLVREIVRRLLAGDPLRSITRDLNDRRVPSPGYVRAVNAEAMKVVDHPGKDPEPVDREAYKWRPSGVKALAVREANAGLRVHHKGKSDERVIKTDKWPALVSQADHDRLMNLVAAGRQSRRGGSRRQPGKRVHLLTYGDVGRCGGVVDHERVCGAQLGARTRGGVAIYHCTEPQSHVTRMQAPVDAMVREWVLARFARPDAIDWVLGDDHAAKRAALLMTELQDRKKRATLQFTKGKLDLDVMMMIHDELDPQIKAAEREYQQHLVTVDHDVVRRLSGKDAPDEWDAMPVHRQRALLDGIGVRVTILTTSPGRGFNSDHVQITRESRS